MRRASPAALPIAGEAPAAAALSSELSELFCKEYDFVWRALRRFGLSTAEVDDGVQEVFLIVAHKLSGYEERGALRAWLFTIARHVASQTRRANTRRTHRQEQAEPPAQPADPEAQAHCRELAELVQRFLDQLDDKQAPVFYLSEVEGLSAPEIAAALDLTLSTVLGRRRLSRERFATFLRRRLNGDVA